MPTPTYTLIDSTVLGSSASSVTFSGISATGKGDLVLIAEYYSTGTSTSLRPRFNSDTGSNYSYVYAAGNGSSATSFAATLDYLRTTSFDVATASSPHFAIIQIMDYSATDKHKSVLVRGNQTQTYPGAGAIAGRWANTNAITQIDCNTNGTDFAAGSSFYLFQIVSE